MDAATAVLGEAGIDSARTDAELLAAHLLGVERGRLSFADVPADFTDRYSELINARANRVPLQHITGVAAFGPVLLEVGPGVFVPRPETEALLEWALSQDLPPSPVIVDVCTGSGALAIALATVLPGATVTGIDADPTALGYARRNATRTNAAMACVELNSRKAVGEAIRRVEDFDPRLFANRKVEREGRPTVVLTPGIGNGSYDFRSNILIVPRTSPQSTLKSTAFDAGVGGAYGAIDGDIGTSAAHGAVAGAAGGILKSDNEKSRVVKNCLRHRGYAVLN